MPGQLHVSKLFKKLKLSCGPCRCALSTLSFFTRRFNLYQINYSVMQKDIIASYLQHSGVCVDSGVYTDHDPLMQCFLFLQSYSIDM